MDRSSITRWLFIGLAVFLFINYGLPLFTGEGSKTEVQPLGVEDVATPSERAEPMRCALEGPRFNAQLTTRGAAVEHLTVRGDAERPDKYIDHKTGTATELVTTTLEKRAPLRSNLRVPATDAAQQLDYADFDWTLSEATSDRCVFSYANADVRLTKTVATTGAPFELKVSLTVENLASTPKKHRLSVEQSAYRTQTEIEGHLGRTSEYETEVVTSTSVGVERFKHTSFEPGNFAEPEFTAEKWRRSPGDGRWVAVSSAYFTNVAIHLAGPAVPATETQIEEYWNPAVYANKGDDPNLGYVFRARLAYPEQELAPNAKTSYETLAFMGPKERKLLAAVGNGEHPVNEAIDLGSFSIIGEALMSYVYFLHDHVISTWGLVICLMTITVRILLFPLSLAQIKSSIAMRRLKPEMDAIGQKYKDDMTQRGLAMQELWRKNNVSSPVVGCIPMLLQMPVWFALYQALQTAVELFNEPFGPFIPDLSQPGKYYIIPIVLGASSFFQQKIMPVQGDPQQQKMMMYLMPGMFTVMMLFLPAGLGVYMMTSTWLGISQQLLVERFVRSRAAKAAAGAITVTEKKTTGDDDPSPPRDIGKGKARAHG